MLKGTGIKLMALFGLTVMALALLNGCSSTAKADAVAAQQESVKLRQDLQAAQQQLATKTQETTKLAQDLQAAQQQAAKAAQDLKTAAVVRNDKEIQNLNTVRPSLASTLDALKAGDVAKAKAVFDSFDPNDYNTIWHGMETYVNARANPLYGELETVHQAKLTALLNDPTAKTADMVKEAQIMLSLWDAIVAYDKVSPALSPVYDDLAAIRLLKAQTLTIITADLKAGDVATSKALYTQFSNRWADVEDMVHERSASAYSAVEDDMAKVNTAFQKTTPDAKELTPLVATLLLDFNFGQSLVNATARNADLAKNTYSTSDVQGAAVLANIQSQLSASLASWKSGNYQDAGAAAQLAGGTLFGNVSASLKAKNGADAALKTALDNYAKVADKAGDAVTVANAELAAVRAAAVAQQVLVGQFWTDSKLQPAILAAAKG